MYLEISGRQSGKTTRLIDFAISKARKGESVLIRTISHEMVGLIRKTVNLCTLQDALVKPKNNPLRWFRHPCQLITVCSAYANVEERRYDWYCYDEFDFNPFIRLEHIQQNSYFVTSPKFLRKVEDRKKTNYSDILYQLVLKKKGKYHSYINPDIDGITKLSAPTTYWQERFGVWKLDKDGYVSLNRKVKSIWVGKMYE